MHHHPSRARCGASPAHRLLIAALPWLAVLGSGTAQACSTCGCTLSSDWSSQGFNASTGLSIDLRHDHFDQDQLRSGAHSVDRNSIALPADQEVQGKTLNRDTVLTIDDGLSDAWGVTVQLPFVQRFHTTTAEGDTALSESQSSGIGDLRVLARYQGFAAANDWGVQVGLKLPTGDTGERFRAGPQAGELVDRGLQAGTGTTDLLLGVYRFGSVTSKIDYFAQGLLQLPVNSHDGFKPGAGLNLTAGLRMVTDGPLQPQLQLNLRSERRESGVNADVPNSGATLAYLSPGLTAQLGERWRVYAFAQLPVWQRVNGLQLQPRVSLSAGVHVAY